MKEEDYILKRVGKDNSFHVPDGYFEDFTLELMDKLPERKKIAIGRKEPTRWERMKPWVYMAAMFIGAALIIRVASTRGSADSAQAVVDKSDTEAVSDEYLSTVLDNSMMDDYSLYIYLTDAGTGTN